MKLVTLWFNICVYIRHVHVYIWLEKYDKNFTLKTCMNWGDIIWWNILDVSLIQTIFLGTKTSGLMRLDLLPKLLSLLDSCLLFKQGCIYSRLLYLKYNYDDPFIFWHSPRFQMNNSTKLTFFEKPQLDWMLETCL